MFDCSISAVIPVYNEEEYLHITMQQVFSVLSDNFPDYEIIFVNDGSRDNSSDILFEFERRYPCVKVLQNNSNKGFAAALKKGLLAAVKEIIFYIDCDLPFDPRFITQAAPLLKTHDIVIARKDPWKNPLRRIVSLCYNSIVKYILKTGVSTVNAGAKAFKIRVLKEIELKSSSAFIDAELLFKAKKMGCKIKEIPCTYQKRKFGYSKTYNIRNLLLAYFDILTYCFRKLTCEFTKCR